jgi:hypothetical protein
MKKLKEIAGVISMVAIILGAVGMSIGSLSSRIKAIYHAPERIEAISDTLQEVHMDVHMMQHAQEMEWELLRLMTDDDDSLLYIITVGENEYYVDIRATAEDVELAFVKDMYIVYPVYYSPADNRKYIILHDIRSDENLNKYLKLVE